MTVTTLQPDPAGACRVCGCTTENACLQLHSNVLDVRPCWWLEPDLCSSCAGLPLDPAQLEPFSRRVEVVVRDNREPRRVSRLSGTLVSVEEYPPGRTATVLLDNEDQWTGPAAQVALLQRGGGSVRGMA